MSVDFTVLLIAFLALASLLSIDDLAIDMIALLKKLKPQALHPEELREMRRAPQKNIAVVVANWREADVIERMLRGNLEAIEYARVWFFVGVYPNDLETRDAARIVERNDPRVVVIENHRPGPTTKGQMLNVVFREILLAEERLGVRYDLFLIHDSEDVLHPQSLLLLNQAADHADFIQIPVFSFPRSPDLWTASTYVDEFAEIHTKDLLVRDALGAAIPSAGVGTAISRRVILRLLNDLNGRILHEDSLTEDYVLGMTVKALGYRSRFVAREIPPSPSERNDSHRNLIATKEFFPASWTRSVRQKSRWIHGIVFQSPGLCPPPLSLIDRLFRLRDRKGPLSSLIGLLGMILFVISGILLLVPTPGTIPFREALNHPWVVTLFVFNLFAGLVRLVQRFRAVRWTQDSTSAWWSLLRVPWGNIINFAAFLRALLHLAETRIGGGPPAWIKTTHELPSGFGQAPSFAEVRNTSRVRQEDRHE